MSPRIDWDLVGNNTPVFFVRDPLKFPDFIHTQKRDPKTNMRSNAAAWDFWSLSPESLHQVTILMSDRGLPRNFRQMNGYGSHTYSFINDNGERYWVKFHFKSMQGHGFYKLYESGEQGRFYFYELWESQAALKEHAASPHYKHLELTVGDLLEEPFEVNILKEAKR